MTNLDWLYEHDREKLLDIASKNVGCRTIFDCPDLVNGECANKNPSLYSACYKRLRELLMAPHEDANDDSAPETDVTAASVDANDGTVTTMPLHVPSETIVNGERVRGIPKIGWSGQTAEKMEGLVDSKPIHATQDEEPTNYTTQGENDAQAAREAAQTADADSREKLEADVREWIDIATYKSFTPARMLEVMNHWLDRRAAITKAEQREWWGGVVAELQAKVDELTAERDEWHLAADELAAERDKLSKHCENQRKELKKANDQIRAYKHACKDDDDVLYNGGGARDWYDSYMEAYGLIEGLERRNVDLIDALENQTYENKRLAHNLGETMAERDEYRALVGQMLDAAQEIRRIADANMPSGARVVVDYEGEVIS